MSAGYERQAEWRDDSWGTRIPQGVDLSRIAGESISSYIDHDVWAVDLQARRFLRKGATMKTRRIDAVWFVLALDNLPAAVLFGKAKMQRAASRQPVRDFKAVVPDLDKARNALEHFDSWRAGLGVRQQKDPGVYIMAISADLRKEPRQGRVVVRLSKQKAITIEVAPAVTAARTLAAAAKAEITSYVQRAAKQASPSSAKTSP